jgi:hypothetical protein
MAWLERIHLRPGERTAIEALEYLAAIRRDLGSVAGLAEVRLYAQSGLAQDVGLHLVWTDDVPVQRTRTGIAVAESLRAFGLVDHSTWKEELR